MMRVLLLGLIPFALTACGGEESTPAAVGDASDGSAGNGHAWQFSVEDSLGGGFDSDSPRARVGWAYESLVDLRAKDGRISVDGRDMPETGPATTTELGFNNTTYGMTIQLDGQSRSVSCKPGDPAQGRFERTELTDERISGTFEVEFVRCTDGNTGQSVEVPGLPVTVTGSFEDLPLGE